MRNCFLASFGLMISALPSDHSPVTQEVKVMAQCLREKSLRTRDVPLRPDDVCGSGGGRMGWVEQRCPGGSEKQVWCSKRAPGKTWVQTAWQGHPGTVNGDRYERILKGDMLRVPLRYLFMSRPPTKPSEPTDG